MPALAAALALAAAPLSAQTWSLRASGTGQPLNDAVFSTASTAIAVGGVGNNGVITVSGDGGATWTLNAYAPPGTRDLNAVFSLAPTAVAVGDDRPGGSGAAAARSNDYGASWSDADIGGVTDGTSMLDVVFSGGSTAVGVGSGSPEVLVSSDRGASWADAFDANDILYAVDARGDGVVAVGDDQPGGGSSPMIVFSRDRGATWSTASVIPVTNADAYDVTFVTTSVVVAVGQTGQVYRSTDGGDTWANQAPVADDLLAVDATGLFLLAVGNNGTIVRSSDGGATWLVPTTNPATQNLNDVRFVAGAIVLAVGDNGQIVGSDDYGDTWSAQSSTTVENLDAIAYNGVTRVVAVGANGTILLSLDQISQTRPIPFRSKLPLLALLLAAGLYALRRRTRPAA